MFDTFEKILLHNNIGVHSFLFYTSDSTWYSNQHNGGPVQWSCFQRSRHDTCCSVSVDAACTFCTDGLSMVSCWISVRTAASSLWYHSITLQMDGWALPSKFMILFFHHSQTFFVLGSPFTVASCVSDGWWKHQWSGAHHHTNTVSRFFSMARRWLPLT